MTLLHDTAAALPELLLATTALLLIVTARLWRHPRPAAAAAAGGVVAAAWALLAQPAGGAALFDGMLVRTPWIALLQVGILGVLLLVILMTLGTTTLREDLPEFFGLLLLSGAGLLLVTGAQSLLMVYVGLELVSLTSYLLTGFLRREAVSAEAGLKYFLVGTLATAMLLYGVSWVYGAAGTLDLSALAAALADGTHLNHSLLVVGALLVLAGLAFKVGLVPFHAWAPDAYEGAPTAVAAFVSAGPKLAGFALLVRVLGLAFRGLTPIWAAPLEVVAILTMTLGNVAALRQTNVKRLLAYSSIAQAGYIVIGVVAAGPAGAFAVTYYALVYVLMNLAAFCCVIAVANATGREDLGAYAGLAQTHPVLAAGFALALLSLAGIPPLAGFLAKVWIFAAALQSDRVLLAVVAAVNSVIAVFYYALLLKQMYLSPPPPTGAHADSPWPLRLALGASLAGVVLLGLWPTPLLTAILAALPTP
ncbi:MAG: hypothetical protein A3C53_05935 [Omnitrophica WOR_2 bacterium RIFCSPHIGHO2_02_FULL_68_15]|nr:MAG: hypothetical protein A3C53_05935 [Omnitrophica WOR_2 bacterium RIFCSPHIGHO2_02_FULL_68_15]